MGRRTQQRKAKLMSDSLNAEVQHWQARTDDMQVALDRLREERDALKVAYELLRNEVVALRSTVSRIQVAMSQGQEL
tara:strand:+ start:1840 stop:2070 length:231 start_codon:yes stop_codon:yes gene_type:complete